MLSKETKMIKDYLKKIGFGKVRVLKGKETECDMLNRIIYFNKDWYDKKNKTLQAHDKVFKEYYAKKLNHKIKISMATYGLFHELGHFISLKDYEGKNFNKAYARYIVGTRNIKTKSLKKSIYQYRNLKMERLADKYAYAIYLLNENSAIQFDKEMRKQFA
jgi:Zn-dependent peptidase ImmA (M78 family)